MGIIADMHDLNFEPVHDQILSLRLRLQDLLEVVLAVVQVEIEEGFSRELVREAQVAQRRKM
jgi:hypothetical protein